MTMHLQAGEALLTVLISKFFSFFGSLMNFPNLVIVASSMFSLSYSINVYKRLVSPNNFRAVDLNFHSIRILSLLARIGLHDKELTLQS